MDKDLAGTDRFSSYAAGLKRRTGVAERIVRKFVQMLPGAVRRSFRRDPEKKINAALARFAAGSDDVFFVQIGACDGLAGDPLRAHVTRRGWRGIVVEPVPENFARLRKGYADCPGVICRNVAVAGENGTRPFYMIAAPGGVDLPKWTSQIGSFDRNHLAKHAVMLAELERYIVEIEVECVDFETLVADVGPERIDLIHTDVEGFDLELLKHIDFDRWKPRLVLFEDFHMSAAERRDAVALMEGAGYDLMHGSMNVLAVRRAGN